ncbi:hypothetical protein P152DRAFT_406335 [Eremomyces bilateralis CBS 781.70]|uniref:Uncharacterized protein n=1 Tax=Eremomyces bilateralis CBS 781.70 TaxID=1392243 RepID=A0A6G1FQG2_9PEZI|nr:uncharacterized protein P152DRAFT_406335 [Eremomyces bilateralis CBS 781.70]KAF1808003.1 hypothetical protein P152DRAFT_406335 [Eremomyces bilateralis CBS 781.70]
MTQSEQTLRTLKSFPLENYVPDAAHVRSDLMPKLGTIVRSEFSVDFELVYEVHGDYDTGDEDNASLLVVRVVPRPDDLKRQFLWFNVTLTVLPDETKGQRRDEHEDSVPLLASIEPASSGDQFADVFTTNETRETALKGTLQAQIYGVIPGIEGSRSSKSEFKAHHLLRVKSGTDRTNMALSRKRANRVWWEVRAANEGDGIGDSFTVALLVKRPKGSKFRVEANTDGEIGVLFEKLKKFVPSGLRSKKDPSLLDVFGPARAGSVQRLPKGVDEKNLHAASRDNVMKRIDEVGLHLQEQGRLVRFEQVVQQAEQTLPPTTATSPAPAPAPTPAPQPSAVQVADPPTSKPKSGAESEMIPPGPVSREPYPRRPAQVIPAQPIYSIARTERLRKMAALYDRLADLLREEARECLSGEERGYADEVERQAW